ncbi:unnamed protein product [Orchesella dallaii]|uniref:Gustatory receptor n=1 Tax=Orchesella dallaii TaxID=48710 RepID=A0ABP1RPD7_9HEXA
MLNESHKTTLRIILRGFCYLYTLPVQWNLDSSQLVILSPSKRNRVAFISAVILNLIYFGACVYIPLSHLLIKTRLRYDLFLVAMHLGAGGCALAVTIFTALYLRWPVMIHGINNLIVLTRQMYSNAGVRLPENIFWIDRLMVPVAFLACIVPFLSLICSPFLGIDVGLHVFEDILPDACFRSLSTIYLVYIIRSVSLFAVVAEAIRITLTAFVTGIVLGESLENYLQFLISGRLDFRRILKQYKAFLIAIHMFDRELNIILVLMLSIFFWVIVLLFFLVVKGMAGIPMVIYVFLVITWGSLVSGVMIWIGMIASVCESSKNVVKTCRHDARYWYEVHLRGYGRRGKILELEANSLQIYSMKYGGFAVIDRQFFVTFLSNLVDQVFTTLMIF